MYTAQSNHTLYAGGGSAVVYHGVDTHDNREVALKASAACSLSSNALFNCLSRAVVFAKLLCRFSAHLLKRPIFVLQVMHTHSGLLDIPVKAVQREVRLLCVYCLFSTYNASI